MNPRKYYLSSIERLESEEILRSFRENGCFIMLQKGKEFGYLLKE